MRRLLSVAVVRAQTECVMSKLRQTGEGVAAANRRRGFAVREEGRWAREREAVMVGRRQGRKVGRQGMFLLDLGDKGIIWYGMLQKHLLPWKAVSS